MNVSSFVKNILKTPALTNCKSVGPEILREFSPPMSHVMFHMSHAMRVRCRVSLVTIFVYFFFLGQSGETTQWRVFYQQGLACPVFKPKREPLKTSLNNCKILDLIPP